MGKFQIGALVSLANACATTCRAIIDRLREWVKPSPKNIKNVTWLDYAYGWSPLVECSSTKKEETAGFQDPAIPAPKAGVFYHILTDEDLSKILARAASVRHPTDSGTLNRKVCVLCRNACEGDLTGSNPP